MIGDVVNIAARLMQAAEGDILCDRASFEAASKRITFEPLPPLPVKGRERPVDVFRPSQLSRDSASEILGRVEERRLLRERLEALVSSNKGGVVVLEGDPGIGKSRLIADVIERAVAKGVRTMVATGDAIERSAPYHAWGALFDNLLGLQGFTGRGDAERHIVDLLQSNPRLVPLAPLLNPVLRLNFHETDESQRIPPRGHALFTRDLLVHLFRCASGGRATLLVLEDAHWLDSASWALAEGIERELPEVLLVIAMRSVSPEERPGELRRLSDREDTLVLRLEALAPDEARRLVCQRVRSRALSEPVARLIRDKAEGHPFFTEEIAYALRDRGLIEVEDGVCRFSVAAASGESMQLPNTVQVVVSSRIDQLNVSQQLTLKVASIFGRTFDLAGLRAAYPIEVHPQEMESHVLALVERDLIQLSSSEPVPTYAFKHAITQEVAYSLLPYALRRQLHAAAAEWYERQHPDDLSPFYPLLAHHWSRAEVGERAVLYLDKAGQQAVARLANEEALRCYTEAVEIDEKFAPVLAGDAPVPLGRRSLSGRDARRTRWERRLGDASTNLCRWDDGRRHFKTVLTLIGHPLPAGKRAFAIGISTEILAQCMSRLAPRLFRQSSTEAADLFRQAVCAYERIGSISYQEGQITPVIYSLVAGLNLAERLGPTFELALVYADVGNVVGLIPLHPVAGMYQRMASQMATRFTDPVSAARVRARAAIYRLGTGDWSACSDLEAAMAICEQIGDSYLWEENAAIRARVAQLRGEFDLAAQLGSEVRKRGTATGAVHHEIWGIAADSWANVYLGHHETALDRAKTGLRLFTAAGGTDWLAALDFLGATALAHLCRSELDEAYHAAQRVIELMGKSLRPGYFAVLGMSAAAETCLAVWEEEEASSRGIEAAAHAQQLCAAIQRYARINPPAHARALLWRGCAEWLAGRREKAASTWRRCLSESERFELPYEAARAHYEIGRRRGPTDAARRAHLLRAEDGFRRLRAESDLKRVALALQGSRSAMPTA
jgi:tetratricopeptide (TPR) repeat protein